MCQVYLHGWSILRQIKMNVYCSEGALWFSNLNLKQLCSVKLRRSSPTELLMNLNVSTNLPYVQCMYFIFKCSDQWGNKEWGNKLGQQEEICSRRRADRKLKSRKRKMRKENKMEEKYVRFIQRIRAGKTKSY